MDTEIWSVRDLVMAIGGDLRPDENRKAWLYRVASLSNVHFRLVRAAWHREPVSKETERRLRTAAERLHRETLNTAVRLQQIAARLEAIDPDFHRADVDALRALARRHRDMDP